MERRLTGGWVGDQVDTYGSFMQRYGYFEARMKIPRGKGVWPAFWMAELASVNGPAELDIMEVCANEVGTNGGNDVTLQHNTVHFSGGGMLAHETRGADLSDVWHTYAMEWRADRVIFYLDGFEVWRYTDASKIPAVAMPIILSLAGGRDWCSYPDVTTPSPVTMYVDWVRAYR